MFTRQRRTSPAFWNRLWQERKSSSSALENGWCALCPLRMRPCGENSEPRKEYSRFQTTSTRPCRTKSCLSSSGENSGRYPHFSVGDHGRSPAFAHSSRALCRRIERSVLQHRERLGDPDQVRTRQTDV